MKYKRGSIVEVLTNDDAPCHSWRCAQIVSGNGHNYTVTYDVYPGFTKEGDVECVSRKSIRPCPPPMELSECWMPGDVAEVFHNLSWKMAIVSNALGLDQFLVRLVGFCKEFEVSKSELRVRQSWHNGEWFVIGKICRNNKDGRQSELLKYNLNSGSQDKQKDANENLYIQNICFGDQNDKIRHGSRIVSSRTLKRGYPYRVEVNEGAAQKIRLAEKDGRCVRVLFSSAARETLCEKDTRTDFDNRRNHFYGDNAERQNGEPKDADGDASSCGSCSINGYKPYEDIVHHDSDAESVCVGYEEVKDVSPSNKELAAEVHRLELQAYRCTMEALHASGPLSWEKETMAKVGGLYTLLLTL